MDFVGGDPLIHPFDVKFSDSRCNDFKSLRSLTWPSDSGLGKCRRLGGIRARGLGCGEYSHLFKSLGYVSAGRKANIQAGMNDTYVRSNQALLKICAAMRKNPRLFSDAAPCTQNQLRNDLTVKIIDSGFPSLPGGSIRSMI